MSQEKKLTPVFCCAFGEYRSPMIAALQPGSETVDGGYIGMANWLKELDDDNIRISDLRIFYLGKYIFLIVNDDDRKEAAFSEALKYVTDLLVKAGIAYAEFDVPELIVKIKTKELEGLLGT